MKVTQIRNATLIVEYAGKTFLIDPLLAEKGAYPPIANSIRQDQRNPLVDLPLPIDHIIKADAVVVTHLHLDHFDDAAKAALPKDIKLFVQSEADAVEVRKAGFQRVEVLQADTVFEDIQLCITQGEHGRGPLVKLLGPVSGVVFKHPSEKTLYVAGDTVWYEGVQAEIAAHQPDVIAVNGGDNQFLQGGSLVMGKDDIYEVHKAAPEATIIATHMEAVNHWTLSRAELRDFIAEKGIASRVLVPEDGESYVF
ncbi:MBL fold metallo-hydrolase [Paenibacillus methanolicus]|uniref:L-ascorbate metabolism protein UlaG (Beta-lactamase superfamily) n=1 Tax=Paenibacillus methanolicus TaxID=582686 RepID=A0A5S5C1Q9_9BACL|nr:MBL fold metallo-hydrolase [Paenibacillus methanolicus]TYP73234.1 L-ascorbate metabolism protein UlaG (beta-lactamase superfamily) [Paenibacillus methanolicus]